MTSTALHTPCGRNLKFRGVPMLASTGSHSASHCGPAPDAARDAGLKVRVAPGSFEVLGFRIPVVLCCWESGRGPNPACDVGLPLELTSGLRRDRGESGGLRGVLVAPARHRVKLGRLSMGFVGSGRMLARSRE